MPYILWKNMLGDGTISQLIADILLPRHLTTSHISKFSPPQQALFVLPSLHWRVHANDDVGAQLYKMIVIIYVWSELPCYKKYSWFESLKRWFTQLYCIVQSAALFIKLQTFRLWNTSYFWDKMHILYSTNNNRKSTNKVFLVYLVFCTFCH